MKILYFLFIVFITCACTPQVAQTSEVSETSEVLPPTSIPTPTLHPQFVELQNRIADSGENLTLLPSGQIEENGVVIPNLQVDSNGVISILVEGKNIIVDSADITFENGITIEGYILDENGEWVLAISPEKQALELMGQYGVDAERVTLSETEGVVSVIDKETGTVLIQTDGEKNWFDLTFAADRIAALSCEMTQFEPFEKNGLLKGIEKNKDIGKYMMRVISEAYVLQTEDLKAYPLLIKRGVGEWCWGVHIRYIEHEAWSDELVYIDSAGAAQRLPMIKKMTKEEIEEFKYKR